MDFTQTLSGGQVTVGQVAGVVAVLVGLVVETVGRVVELVMDGLVAFPGVD